MVLASMSMQPAEQIAVGMSVRFREAPLEVGVVRRVDARGVVVRFASGRQVICEPGLLEVVDVAP